MGMEKFGVSCKCVEGHPNMDEMIKQGNGDLKCGDCGRLYGSIKLADQIQLKENDSAPVKDNTSSA